MTIIFHHVDYCIIIMIITFTITFIFQISYYIQCLIMFQLLKTTNKTNKQTNKQNQKMRRPFMGSVSFPPVCSGGSDTSLRSQIKRPRGANKKILRGSPQREVVANQFNQYHLVMYEPDYLWTPKPMKKMKVLGPLILWVIS